MTTCFDPCAMMQIVFNPFSTTIICKEKLQNLASIEILGDVDWCSLPDILYSVPNRKFVGLSFAVDLGKEDFAVYLVESSNNNNVRFVPATGLGALKRYSGFGPGSRLEIFWSIFDESTRCELASLFDGVWMVNKNDRHLFKGVSVPSCYRLLDIDDILVTYGLKFPSNLAIE